MGGQRSQIVLIKDRSRHKTKGGAVKVGWSLVATIAMDLIVSCVFFHQIMLITV